MSRIARSAAGASPTHRAGGGWLAKRFISSFGSWLASSDAVRTSIGCGVGAVGGSTAAA